MVARSALYRLLPLALLLAPALLLAEPIAESAAIPPEPPRPNLRGLSPAQQREVTKTHRTATHEWEKALPAIAKAQHDAQKAKEGQELALRFSLFANAEQEALLISQTFSVPWRDAAARAGLSPAEIEKLARDKVLIEDRQVAQSFSPYIDPDRAVFVTTDSLLNGFHVLLNESIFSLQRHRTKQLRRHLEGLIPRVRKDGDSLKIEIQDLDSRTATRHAEMVIGPAIVLLRGSLDSIDPASHAEVLRQVELIRRAEAQEQPTWLASSAHRAVEVDYRRFSPSGFYAFDAVLADYFRAIRWLQTIPFRASVDHELLAAALLDKSRDAAFFEGLMGYAGTTSIDTFEPWATMPYSLPSPLINKMTIQDFYGEARRSLTLTKHHSGPLYFRLQDGDNDTANDASDPLQFATSRFLPPSVSFGDDRPATNSSPPDGLLIAAAHNSAFARARLPQPAPSLEQLINLPELEVPETDFGFSVGYFNISFALAAAPQETAPDFMRGEAWAAKSCLSILAGWAQAKQRPAPQFRTSGFCDCDTFTLPGFIEPNASFYTRLADLAAGTAEYFARQEAFLPLPDEEISELRVTAAKARSLGPLEDGYYPSLPRKAQENLDQFLDLRWSCSELLPQYPKQATREAERLALISALELRANQLEKGIIPPRPSGIHLPERWFRLVRLAANLAQISHDQLRGTPVDQSIIQKYGHTLGFIMGYGDSSWMIPRDDGPRWAEVHRPPTADRGLAIGIGRPRLIHVLYPYEGREILCTGSVMSYYEYWERDRLTDEEWKTKLDGSDAPAPPDWLTPYMAR